MNKSMKFIYTFSIIFSLSLIANSSFGQLTNYIHSAETSFELGLGGANYGLQAKANHHWTESEHLTTMSSLSFSTFWSSIGNYTQYYPELVALSDITGFRTDNHLRIYSGVRLSLFKKRKFTLSGEGYFGGYHAYMNGSHFHERLQINQDYSASQFFFDYGTRFSIGYQINDKIGVNATLNNSFRQLNYGYRVLPMIYQYNPDNKMSLGVGVIWNLSK